MPSLKRTPDQVTRPNQVTRPSAVTLTNRLSFMFNCYHHPTLILYCYYNRPWLLCLQLINYLLLYLQLTNLYCSASSDNRI